MSVVVAAGFLIFRQMQRTEYLLLQTSYGEHHWTPPKGHVDPGESEYETALRETMEEAGINEQQLSIMGDFKKTLHYEVKGKPKKVVYWLAQLCNPLDTITLSHEHRDFKWLDVEDACKYSKFPDMIEVIKEAQRFLEIRKNSS